MSLSYKLLLITLFVLQLSVAVQAQTTGRLAQKELYLPSLYLTVQDILHRIEQDGIALSYSSSALDMQQRVTLKTHRIGLDALLQLFLPPERIRYLENKVLILPPSRWVVSGYVYDAKSGEALIGATVSGRDAKVLAVTNEFGFYTVSVPSDTTVLTVSYIGYSPGAIKPSGAKVHNVFLTGREVSLSEAVVLPKISSRPLAGAVVDVGGSVSLPSVTGNDDVMQRLQDASGVATQGVFQPLSIRADRSDNNLVLLDGIPVYSYMHIFSMFSIFNSAAIQKATLYSGLFPSRYEGRTGAVMDITMKDGNKQRMGGTFNFDMASVSATLEGPLIKKKMSFMLSARRSWIDALPLIQLGGNDNIRFSLYDLYAKVNFRPDSINQFYLSAYVGGDQFGASLSTGSRTNYLQWNNYLFAFRWNHIFSDQWYVHSTLSASSYRNATNPESNGFAETNPSASRIHTLSLRSDFTNSLSNRLDLNLGYSIELTGFDNRSIAELPTGVQYDTSVEKLSSIKASVYSEARWDVSDRFNVRGGFNLISYHFRANRYQSVQPRLQLGFRTGAHSMLFAGYSRMGQYYHQLTMPLLAVPDELRIPSSENVKPSYSDLFEAGLKADPNKSVRLSASVYYKMLTNVLSYRPAQDPSAEINAPSPFDRVMQGSGNSYGLELTGTVLLPKWTLNVAYRYTQRVTHFPLANTYLNMQFLIPHQLNLGISWMPAKKSVFSSRLLISSGMLQEYPVYSLPLPGASPTDSHQIYYNSEAASVRRYPVSYQWDAGYTLRLQGFAPQNTFELRTGISNLMGANRLYSYTPVIAQNYIRMEQNRLLRFIPYLGITYYF